MNSDEQQFLSPARWRESCYGIKTISYLRQPEENPVLYSLYAALFYLLCLLFPQYLWLDITLAVFVALVLVARPLWGVFLIIAAHPIMMCYFDILWPTGMPIEIIQSMNTPYSKTVLTVSIYPFQIVSYILLPSIFFHCRPSFSQNINKKYQRIAYITLSIFLIWGVIISLQARYLNVAFLGMSRFISLVIIISYLIRFVQTLESLKRLMVIWSSVALILPFFAYYGTYNGFESATVIWHDYGLTVSQLQGLANGSSSFIAERQGLMPGFGLSGKHEFSTFLAAGLFFSIYLFTTAQKKIFSVYYLCTGSVILIALFYGPAKLTLAGIIISTLLVSILTPSLRRHISFIVVGLFGLLIFASLVSGFTRPPYVKHTVSTSNNFKVVNDSSQFSASFKGRIAKMKSAAQFIKSSYGIGIGPDMLKHDPVFLNIHGHNFFITLFAEYGFPSFCCVLVLGIITVRRVIPIITSQACRHNTVSFIAVPVSASFFAIFFEYNFDCYVWAPQLWITGALLWIAVNQKEEKIICK